DTPPDPLTPIPPDPTPSARSVIKTPANRRTGLAHTPRDSGGSRTAHRWPGSDHDQRGDNATDFRG
ncbi:MAG: hypothetical protein ACRDSH_15715, partial [Pseudonocardiaceae bacterium]